MIQKKKTSTPKKSKKLPVSAKTALFLSAFVLLICVVMLVVTINITEKPTKNIQNDTTVVKNNSDKDSSQKTTQKPTQEQLKTNNTTKKTPVEKKSENIPPKKETVQKKKETTNSSVTNSNVTSQKTVTQNATPIKPSVKSQYSVYIVLDDGGHNLSQLKPFLDLSFPVTIAVLPNLAHSVEAANQIRNANKCLMLHQPMQAINLSTDPGPGAIKPGMTADEILFLLEDNISQLGKIAGMNNHEGSLITADEYSMQVVMQYCKQNDIFFLDSRTNSESVCKKIANQVDVDFYERNIFLDNSSDEQSIKDMFNKGLQIAKKEGSVIMIGHIWSGKNLADILQKEYALSVAQGYEFKSMEMTK